MKKIDIFASQKAVNPLYLQAQMPLFVCHSTEEFKEVTANDELPPTVFNNIMAIAEWVKGMGFTEHLYNYPLSKFNLWLTTGEVYKPDYQTETNQIIYQTDNMGMPLHTDNCYIQLVGIQSVKNAFYIATSSGIYHISVMHYELTAAVKQQFRDTITTKMGNGFNSSGKRMAKLLEGKRVTPKDVRFVHYLLHADSPVSDINSAGKEAYGHTTSKKTIARILNSERIKNLFIQEASKVVPNLADAILKVYPLEDIAADLKKMVTNTVNVDPKDFDQEAAEKALSFVIKNLDVPNVIGAVQSSPLIEGKQPTMISAGDAQLQAFDANIRKVSPETGVEEEVIEPKLNKQEMFNREEELGTPHGAYVTQSTLPKEMKIPKFFDDDTTKE